MGGTAGQRQMAKPRVRKAKTLSVILAITYFRVSAESTTNEKTPSVSVYKA